MAPKKCERGSTGSYDLYALLMFGLANGNSEMISVFFKELFVNSNHLLVFLSAIFRPIYSEGPGVVLVYPRAGFGLNCPIKAFSLYLPIPSPHHISSSI